MKGQYNLQRIYKIVSQLCDEGDEVIADVKFSPDRNKLILDVNFNKALEITCEGNKVIIKGELNSAKYLQKLLYTLL